MSSDAAETVVLGQPREEASSDEPTVVGRYILAGRLGLGGMGVVYRAYDPELDRKVALKRLRVREGAAGQRERLLREAQSLAQLSHPNVIAVHDVGIDGEHAFIAMELVEGQTLGKWLRDAGRSVAEIRHAFAQAGRGLAAAHAIGLIHRDFKPDNVIVGEDGRVRVLDFGLARLADGELPMVERAPTPLPDAEATGEQLLYSQLTQAGSVMGTPAYMAPEQHGGGAVDARADVFAFAVTLYRALFRRHPFTEVEGSFREAILAGTPAEPPGRAGVSRTLRALVMRALARDPAARPDMSELIAELERDPHQRRKRLAAAGGVTVLLTGMLLFAFLGHGDPRCQGAEARLAGVWDAAARTRVEEAFAATGRPYAADTFARVATILDAYTARWVNASTATCEATHVQATQAARVLDLRMRCLDERLGKVSALVAALARTDNAAALDNAVQAAADLPPLERCDDVKALEARQPPPEDPAVRARVEALDRRLYEAEAIADTGNMVDALEKVRLLVEEARAIDYLPVQVRALNLLATLYTDGGDAKETERLLQEIIDKAARAKEDDLAAQAWIALIRNVGEDQAEMERALALQRPAEAAVLRAGDSDYLRAGLRHNLALVLAMQGKEEEALEHNRFVLEVWERVLGADNPSVAVALNNLGGSFFRLGRKEEALAHYQRALELWERTLGPGHPDVAIALTNVAMVKAGQGHGEEAEALLLRALAIKEAAYGPDHPTLVATLGTLGVVVGNRGALDQALAHQRRALVISERELGPAHPRIGVGKFNAALVLLEQEHWSEARELLVAARQVFADTFGADHQFVGYADVALARCDIGEGKAQQALDRLAPVLDRWTAGGDAVDLASARFAEAKARDALGQHGRAVKLARQAETAYAAAGEGSAPDLRKVQAWLARGK